MDDQQVDNASVRFPPPLVYLAGILLGVAAHRWLWPFRLEIGNAVRISLALVVAVMGITFNVLSFQRFRGTGQDVKPWTSTPEIIAEGIYHYTRNPMYVGLAFVQLGISIALGNLWIAALLLPVLYIVYVSAVRPEETYLERKFGDEYRTYRSSVRRWL
jgi:protein-S-isoprenylcysteine O-methyltransferase Ste14